MIRFGFPTLLLVSLVFLAGCGGSGSSGTGNNSPIVATNAPPGDTSVHPPAVIALGGGQSAAGVDINVPAPASSPVPNAEVLGVSGLTGPGTATNTGGTIRRGSTMRVLLFGAGLTGNMQVTVGGPLDISVTNVAAIKATDGTPGIVFLATVSGNAALGARTVYLRNSQDDITAFTGGLEVVP